MGLEYYYDLLSQPSRAVWLLMKCGNVDFDSKTLDLFKGEHHTNAEFKKKNPSCCVPTICDGDFCLTECVAILRYIAVSNNMADHWYPRADAKKQARCDEFLSWQQFGVRKPCVEVFLNNYMAKIGFGEKKPLDKAATDKARESIKKNVKYIADYFLQDRQFICGDEISAADILGVMELVQLIGIKEESLYNSEPKVKAWVERVKNRLNPHFDESLARIKGIKEQYSKA